MDFFQNKYYKTRNRAGRRAGAMSLGEGLKAWMETSKLGHRLQEASIVESWEAMMGKMIANRTGRIFVKDGKLFVQITSAPLKKELAMSKRKIVEIICREFGEGVIQEVVLL